MMPLGPQFLRVFKITPALFSHLVASYSVSAAVTGFAAGFFLDRFDRKRSLLFLYGGFCLSTLCCALSTNYSMLLIARTIAGAFGGVAASVVLAIIGDVIPPERRGTAMGIVMTSFSIASVLGVPAGLYFANLSDWHAPFFILGGTSALVFFLAVVALPKISTHRAHAHKVTAVQQMRKILLHPTHLRAFALSFMLIATGSLVIPFLSPSMVANAGLTEKQLPFIYLFGGLATFVTTPWFGRLSDRYDKLKVFGIGSVFAAAVILAITNMPPAPLWLVLSVTTLFMIGMSARFTPAMAMITNSVEARYRGGFMSVNAAVQQVAGGIATLVAGWLVTSDASGHLRGYPMVGLVAAGCAVAAFFMARRLRHAPIRKHNDADPTGALVTETIPG